MANYKKPASVHVLNGTYRPGKHGQEPEIERGAPDKPIWLSKSAELEWDRVVPILEPAGYLAKSDAMALATYCELAAEFAAAPSEFRAGKIAQLRLLMAELGLTPSGRAKMPAGKSEGNKNPFEGI